MLRATSVRLSQSLISSTGLTGENNPYRAHKPWPPDFAKLTTRQKFSFERRYKRRTKRKYSRPAWNRGVKIFSWVACGSVFIYGILFLDWNEEFGTPKEQFEPFADVREWIWSTLDSIWTTSSAVGRTPPTDSEEASEGS